MHVFVEQGNIDPVSLHAIVRANPGMMAQLEHMNPEMAKACKDADPKVLRQYLMRVELGTVGGVGHAERTQKRRECYLCVSSCIRTCFAQPVFCVCVQPRQSARPRRRLIEGESWRTPLALRHR